MQVRSSPFRPCPLLGWDASVVLYLPPLGSSSSCILAQAVQLTANLKAAEPSKRWQLGALGLEPAPVAVIASWIPPPNRARLPLQPSRR